MQFCDDHWEKLKGAIDILGLTPLVSENGQTAVERFVAQLKGDESPAAFDPLIYAHNAIVANATDLLGFRVLFQAGCPVCYIIKEHAEHCKTPGCTTDYENWITIAAEESKKVFDKMMQGSS